MTTRFQLLSAAAVFALVLGAYSNHFHNGFHFDDDHALMNNPFVRDLRNVPRYFTDATTFSILPLNQAYRPALQTTFAIDYRVGGGYNPIAFQLDSFAWFIAVLLVCWRLFALVLRAAEWPGADSVALVATAVYGLHPVCAETVNYIVQRGDLMSAFGVIAALGIFVRWPGLRRTGLYLLPAAIALLAKPTAFIFPLLVLSYVGLFERAPTQPVRAAARAVAPSAVFTSVVLAWMQFHTPPTFTPGATAPGAYWITQPFVSLRYFVAFWLPIDLSADNDWPLLHAGDPRVYLGFAFVAAVVWAARRAGRRREMRPIAFGLWWFLAGLAPTALLPLAEVANDHRMFFPFAGLALAVACAASIAWRRVAARSWRAPAAIVLLASVLVAEAAGVRARNAVWSSDEALWHDVTLKSPRNGRGLMNYGLVRLGAGDYRSAIAYLERARQFTPDYSLLHVNLGIGYGRAGRPVDAERSFRRAIAIAPDDWRSHVYYGRWLLSRSRRTDGLAELAIARRQNPADPMTADLLERAIAAAETPEALLGASLADYQTGEYRRCIAHAEQALALRPGYAEAYNNIAAAHNALGEWDAGIRAAERAVALKPDLAIARNNLAYARQRRGGTP